MSCSIHTGSAANSADGSNTTLSRPASANSPSAAPRFNAGFCDAGISGPQAKAARSVAASNRPRSMPMRAAGTSPNSISAEKRPPTSGGARNTARKPRSVPRAASEESGSVIATNRLPGSSTTAPTRVHRYRKKERVSRVPPDFDATMNSVVRGSTASATRAAASGCVESRTVSLGPSTSRNTDANTSGARLDPPMPSKTTSVSPSARASSAKASMGPMPSDPPGVSQPRRLSISSRGGSNHKVGSRSHRRAGNSDSSQAARRASMAAWSSPASTWTATVMTGPAAL